MLTCHSEAPRSTTRLLWTKLPSPSLPVTHFINSNLMASRTSSLMSSFSDYVPVEGEVGYYGGESIILEVTLQPQKEKTDIVCFKKAAKVSPVLDRIICEIKSEEPAKRSSIFKTKPGVPPSATDDKDVPTGFIREDGKLVIRLPSPVCTVEAIKKIIEWCQYHVDDAAFEEACAIEDFDEDEFQEEQERITELPCHFDWQFITDIAGEKIDENAEKRVAFYELMATAHYLGLKPILLLGGKYICRQIRGKSVDEVRTILGIINDLPKGVAEQIQAENERILNPHKNKPRAQ